MGGANVNVVGGDRKYKSTAVEKSKVVSTQAGKVHHVIVYNKSGADFYLQIFDLAALPANAQPADFPPLLVPAGATGFYDIPHGCPMDNGIVVAASTTDTTITLLGANGAWFHVVYQEK